MFRTVPLSTIMSISLHTKQWYMSYRFSESLRAGSGRNCFRQFLFPSSGVFHCTHSNGICHVGLVTDFNKPVCIAVCAVKTPDDRQSNSPKHTEFWSKNKFENLVHLVGFIIRTLHPIYKCKTLHISVDKKNQLDVTFCILYFSSNSCSTCFGQPSAHHQELTTA